MNRLGVILDRERDRSIDVEADGIADLLKGDGNLVLYGLDGKVQDLGYFPVFKTVFLDELENDLAFWWKLIDGPSDQRQHIGRDQQLFRIEIDAGELRVKLIQRVGDGAFLMAEIVECSVADGDIEIDLQIVDLLEIAPLLPNTYEHVRYDLLRGFPGLDHRFRKEE